jgi:hypothetical protein
MVEATPAATFEMSKPDLLLEFLVVAFEVPSEMWLEFGSRNLRSIEAI